MELDLESELLDLELIEVLKTFKHIECIHGVLTGRRAGGRRTLGGW